MEIKDHKSSSKFGSIHSFLKMIQLELKTNKKNWAIYLTVGVLSILVFELSNEEFYSFFSLLIFIFSTNALTLSLFSESSGSLITRQYYLLPVHANIKFFSKLILSFVVFPLLLSALTIVIIELWHLLIEPSIKKLWVQFLTRLPTTFLSFWLFSQSASALLGVLFKRKNTIYALSVYIGLILLTLPFWVIIGLSDFKSPEAANNFFTKLSLSLVVISFLVLVFSYIKFRRRRL